MTNPNNSSDATALENEERFHQYGRELLAAVEGSFQPWLTALLNERNGGELPADVVTAIGEASAAARSNIAVLIETDVDVAVSGPLEQLRRAVAALPPVLDAHGFERPKRDPVDSEMRPDDVHSLGPMSFMDLGSAVHDAGIAWGAAKAFVHHQRRA